MPQVNLRLGKYGVSTGFGGGRGLYFKLGALPMSPNVSGSRYALGGRSMFYGLLPGAQIDYVRKAGDAWKNAIISAALSWIARNLPYAPLVVYTETADAQEKIVPRHPLTALLKRPNKFYDGKTLLQATFLSLIAGRGNAYWWVKRDNVGRPLEFWYLPHFDVWPIWDNESTTDTWIIGYAYRQNGKTYVLKNEEILHFRDGIDPENPRLGIDYLKAGAREIVTDNAASGYAAQLLENMCIPGAIIHPKGQAVLDDEGVDLLKEEYEQSSGGANRFRPMVAMGDIAIEHLSLNPQEMALDTMQDRPEARLLSIIGISPMVLDMMIGLEHSTYSNKETAEKAAWYNCIMPRIALICSEIDTQVLASYPNSENQYTGGDYRKVPALQDNLDEKYKRISLAVGGPFLTRNEGREQLGLQSMEGGDELYELKPAIGEDGDKKPKDTTPKSGKAMSNGAHRHEQV